LELPRRWERKSRVETRRSYSGAMVMAGERRRQKHRRKLGKKKALDEIFWQ
jgi:hypothetical protein